MTDFSSQSAFILPDLNEQRQRLSEKIFASSEIKPQTISVSQAELRSMWADLDDALWELEENESDHHIEMALSELRKIRDTLGRIIHAPVAA